MVNVVLLVINARGFTLNFMIMFAMLLSVGILVDGAIIVVEYADRKMTEGVVPKQAFAEAAQRMFWPVVSSTATMIGAFLPMLLWPGIPGEYMSFFPNTLIIVLSCSMVVALIFMPVLGGFFGKAPEHDKQLLAACDAYDEIVEPEKIVYHANFGHAITRVIVEFFEQGQGTKVVLTHEGCPDEFFSRTVSQGTTESLDKLDSSLASQAVVLPL